MVKFMELTTQQIETIAKAIHEDYRTYNSGSRYDMPWEILPDDIKQSNRDQAQEFVGYVNLFGLNVDFDIKSAKQIKQLTNEQIEILANRIHEIWMKSKKIAGWRYGAMRNDEKRLHPMLIPYNELSIEEKDKDRTIAQSIVPLFRKAGVILKL